MPQQLLVVRHAIALEREEAAAHGLSDGKRPLTGKGRQRMEQTAAGIRSLCDRPVLILSSPLLRAHQTAEILAAHYQDPTLVLCDELAPSHPPTRLVRVLQKQQSDGLLVVVGHEPQLSTLVALLLCGQEQAFITLKKGGAALLEFTQGVNNGSATLNWLLQPKQLRQLNKT
ncbi:MAG: histidine phosphatase family protein [Gammaproteobacteria bacterium]|nr:histidine phosphatase family protein [Gammaproteobacteria bacterium]MCW8841764.1 histidine phosphatase family protein [Gammaproteobacteria bacterium]MCW8957782.1 histidine phosphatase family protein [Gammaproteobacteria bacterium]MCW8973101.1 histidine phosphatase family protein [Gammaproteobacteria bacterium]MCW8993214.1 histidine phosphatase family protein [Gammaproteobacteria bacterium]